MLPVEFAGEAVEAQSLRGEAWIDPTSPDGRAFVDFFESLGGRLEDASLAYAGIGFDYKFYAKRVRGVDAEASLHQFLSLVSSQDPGSTVSEVTIDNRPYLKWQRTGGLPPEYSYAKGDIWFSVVANDDEEAARLLAVMPH